MRDFIWISFSGFIIFSNLDLISFSILLLLLLFGELEQLTNLLEFLLVQLVNDIKYAFLMKLNRGAEANITGRGRSHSPVRWFHPTLGDLRGENTLLLLGLV